ncbi:MAG: nickel pincer cofactor biosynthesis protein LarB [Clostridia bacterium]|nr:nickel pincer cofactor biosynthesis protein LarB [Clostridia bacterium]
MKNDIKKLLEDVRDGKISTDKALLILKKEPFEDLGFAKIDHHRRIRQGAAEVIYGAGKTAEQIISIINAMKSGGQNNVIITRLDKDKALAVADQTGLHYYEEARFAAVGDKPVPSGIGKIVVATGGTSDIPVAEEAALTAEYLGNDVTRIYDVGVAGLHRLLDRIDDIMSASVIIAVAGMEGALASVIGGLADCPVIAVPTSVGYGAAFDGLTALLAMMNSCASGVTVVNIDNGFGAGYSADMINHMEAKK